MSCQSTTNIKVNHKMEKSNKRQKMQQKEPFAEHDVRGNPLQPENYYQKKINNNKHRQIKLLMPKGNQVVQITIEKISLPILASGITHN